MSVCKLLLTFTRNLLI